MKNVNRTPIVDPLLSDDDDGAEQDEINSREESAEDEYSTSLAEGKKYLLCGDFSEAVASFQVACTLQSEKYDDTSPECAEVFYFYGRALLELARVENGVLGNALKGVPDTEDSDSDVEKETQFEKVNSVPAEQRVQLRQEVEEAMATENEEADESEIDDEPSETEKSDLAQDPAEKEDKKLNEGSERTELSDKAVAKDPGDICEEAQTEEKVVKADETEPEKCTNQSVSECSSVGSDEPSTSAGGKKSEKGEEQPVAGCSSYGSGEPSTSSGIAKSEGAEEEIDPDDIPNLQLAWEMLELARRLYEKKPKTDENKLMSAQCSLKLGDLSLEIEQYGLAIEDYNECLAIKKEILSNHDRQLAEIHYSLGLAYAFDQSFDKAIEHYYSSLDVLEKRIVYVTEQMENVKEVKKDKEEVEFCNEIGELKELIPDINSKLEDVILMKKDQEQVKRSLSMFQKSSLGETSTGFGSSSTSNQSPVCTLVPVRKGSAAVSSTSDISHLVRRKRNTPDDEATQKIAVVSNKKLKSESSGETKEVETDSNGVTKDEGAVELRKATKETVPVTTNIAMAT